MGKAKTWSIISISLILVFAFMGAGEARNYQTWCKSFSTGENLACSTYTDYGGSYSYTPGVAPTIYNVPDNTLFNVQYEAGGHEKGLFSMFLDSQISSCTAGADCTVSNGRWETRCVWNGVDSWICTIYYQEEQINQYYLLVDHSVRDYRYLALSGNSNSAPIITAVPAKTYAENAGSLSNIVDMWFYTGDDRTPKQGMAYSITGQTNPGVVSCSISSNRYINGSTQPSAHGFSDITFSATDAGGATTSSTFRITITPANPAPSIPSEKITAPASSVPFPSGETPVEATPSDQPE
jgi:hypothetical protein